MDYETFFGLRERPFKSAPQEKFFCPRAAFGELAALLRGEKAPQTIVLKGAPGSGKTLFLLCLPFALGPSWRSALSLRAAPTLSGILSEALGSAAIDSPPAPGAPEEALVGIFQSAVSGFVAEGASFLLAVDGAERLGADTLSDLAALAALEPSWRGRVSLLLACPEGWTPPPGAFGEPPAEVSIPPLDLSDAREFLEFRAKAAGGKGKLFSKEAVRRLHALSGGSPRELCLLAERALMTAWAEGKREVSPAHALRAKASLDNPAPVREEGARLAGGAERDHHRVRGLAAKKPLLTAAALFLAVAGGLFFLAASDGGTVPGEKAAGKAAAAAAPAKEPASPPGEAIPALSAREAPEEAPDLGLPTPPPAILALPRNSLALVVDRSLTMSRLWQGGLSGPGLKAEVALPEITQPGLYLVGRPQSRTPLIFQYPPAKEVPQEASLRLWGQMESFLPQDILPLIVGSGADLKKAAPGSLAPAIKEKLKVWTQSQELRRPDQLAALYDETFRFFEPGRRDRTVARENFRQALMSEMRTAGDTELTVSEPLILLDPRDHGRVWAVFSLRYDSRLRHDIGLRTLVFERRGAAWLITAELWIKELSLKT